MSVATDTVGWTLAEIAAAAGGVLELPPGSSANARAAGVTIDSRTLEAGALFVPLPGSNVDGHQFLAAAFARGAAAALCARSHAATLAGRTPGALIVVDDVTAALQRFAAAHRRAFTGELIGVTGSAGKTTTKDLVAAALAADRPTLATQGNLNNHWGVPLTLMRLAPEHRAAVIEMGMSHPGEIAALAAISAPTAAVVTNAGTAHLEFFGSVAAIAREKASLAAALAPGRPVFAGADSPELLVALRDLRARVVTYGLEADADVRPAAFEDLGAAGCRITVAGFPPLALSLVGRHQVRNALAAFAVARELALDPARTVAALAQYRAAQGRMEVRPFRGATLLLDHYNANPDSARAALETLATWPGARRRIAVLGDMLELGPGAAELHRAVGAAARDAELWLVGRHAADYAAGAATRGTVARIFDDQPSLAAALGATLAPGDVVLFKGSRGAALEQTLEALGAAAPDATEGKP